jgi:hypothetical protein
MYLPRRRSAPRLGLLLVGLVVCSLFGLGVGSAVAQTPAAPEITGGPAEGAFTNNPTQIFEFRSGETRAGDWECRVDGEPHPVDVPQPGPGQAGYGNCGPLNPCTPPATGPPKCGSFMTTLPDGSHSFDVRVCVQPGQAGGTCGNAARREFTVDTMAPETVINSAPPELTNDSTPIFTFGSNEPTSTFRCSRDGAPPAPCGSTHTVDPPLGDGDHSFDVYAIDSAGNSDLSPAHAAFTVDTVDPVTRITGGPAGTVDDPRPTFIFSANESMSGFECRIDDARFTACASPFTPASALSDGNHVFQVRAIDLAGNRGPADSLSFTVAARGDGTGGQGPGEPGLPAPKVGRSVNLSVVRGRVRVRTPGSGSFIELTSDAQVPVGSLIDTRRGTVRLTSARNAAGATRSAEFSLGVFRVLQSRGRRPSTDAVIEPPKCARTNAALARARATRLRLKTITAPAAAAAKGRVIRDRSSAALGARRRKEEWRVKGKYSRAGSVATEWGTIERCDRTTTVVREGRVRVFDRVRRRTVSVGRGQRYKAPARR